MGEMFVKVVIKIFSNSECTEVLENDIKNRGSVEKLLLKFFKSKTLFIVSDNFRCLDSGIQDFRVF